MTRWLATAVVAISSTSCKEPHETPQRLATSATPEPARAPASAPPSAVASAVPESTAKKRPAEADWEKEDIVMKRAAGAIRCDVKKLGSWMRVACRTADPDKPPILELKKGNFGDFFEGTGEIGFYYEVAESQEIHAEVTSGGSKVGYRFAWPKGTPRPEATGAFEGGTAVP